MDRYLFALVGLLMMLQCTGLTDFNCGKLNENMFYDEKPQSALDEFPWIGRIYYKDIRRNLYLFSCTSILISKRNMLTAAHCFTLHATELIPEYVLLGDTYAANNDTEPDCDENGLCSPVSAKYIIKHVAIHPCFDIQKKSNDIAVIYLESDVEFNDYVQPICLPPDATYSNELIAQYYPVSGFLQNRIERTNTSKIKTVAHIIAAEQCRDTLSVLTPNSKQPQLDSSILCVSNVGSYNFLSGTALMGVNVVNSKPKSFYLIGILSYGTSRSRITYDVYMRVSSHINWIRNNMELSFSGEFSDEQLVFDSRF